MKKFIFLLQACLLLAVSCAQNETVELDGKVMRGISVDEIVAVMPQVDMDGVKSTLSFDGSTLTTAWSENDKIGFWPKDIYTSDPGKVLKQAMFYVSEGGSSSARFKANGWGLLSGQTYYSYYPYDAFATKDRVAVDFSGQTQDGNGNISHLSSKDVFWGMVENVKINESTINYNRLATIAKFNLTLPGAGTSVKSMTLSFDGEALFAENATFNPCSNTQPALFASGEKSKEMTVTLTNVSSDSGNKVVVYAMMCPTAWQGKTINVKVTGTDNLEYTGTFEPGKNQSAGDLLEYNAELSGEGEPETITIKGQVYQNLCHGGYANCYIVPREGYYCINVTKKGNGEESIDKSTIGNVQKFYDTKNGLESWEDDASNHYSDGYAYFYANGTATNVVLIARQTVGQPYYWSWHIWCPGTNPGTATLGTSSYTLMDRNLGALSSTGPGSMYQWGRKDPFPGSSDEGGYWKSSSVVKKDANTGTIDYSIKNPQYLIRPESGKGHWINTDDLALWGTTKTMYDPCPAGYKVPDEGVRTYSGSASGWPTPGFIDSETFGWSYPNNANYWTTACSTNESGLSGIPVGKTINCYNGSTWNAGLCHAFAACSVRCQKIQ